MQEFVYRSRHIPTGKMFKTACQCESRLAFLEHINAWNHNNGEWLYLADIRRSSYSHPKLLKQGKVEGTY